MDNSVTTVEGDHYESEVGGERDQCKGEVRGEADLDEGVLPQQRAGEGGRGPQEARICHFLYCLSDGQHQRGVDERHDDVGVKLICQTHKTVR